MLNFIQKESAKSFIQNNKLLLLPTDSTLVLAGNLDCPQLQDFSDQRFYLFSENHSNKIFEYSKNAPSYVKFLISAFLPGTIIFKLKKDYQLKDSDSITIYQPNNSQTSDFLSEFEKPLQGFIPRNNLNIPFINQEVIESDESFAEIPILESNNLGDSILPTVLDCTQDNLIKILHPGIVPAREIQSILPKEIKLEKDYQNSIFKNQKTISEKIYLTDTINLNNPELTLVIGTKEKLKETFGLGFLSYFKIKQIDNFILLNLGSQTNLEGIAKNLYKNFLQISKMGISRTVILNQNWGKSHWAEIISSNIDQVVTPVYQEKTETISDEIISPVTELNLASL